MEEREERDFSNYKYDIGDRPKGNFESRLLSVLAKRFGWWICPFRQENPRMKRGMVTTFLFRFQLDPRSFLSGRSENFKVMIYKRVGTNFLEKTRAKIEVQFGEQQIGQEQKT